MASATTVTDEVVVQLEKRLVQKEAHRRHVQQQIADLQREEVYLSGAIFELNTMVTIVKTKSELHATKV